MKINKKAKTLSTNQNTAVGYNGEVTITLYKNNKKYKQYTRTNHGQLKLFEYLAHALNAELVASLRPTLIQITGEVDGNETLLLQTAQPLVRSTPGTDSVNQMAYVIFDFLIPYTNLIITQSTAIKKLILVSSAGLAASDDLASLESNASAIIELDEEEDPVEVSLGVDLKISWVLQLQQVNENN